MRIKLQLKRPNPLFESWIEELYFESVAENKSTQQSLKLALDSLKLFPLRLHSGMECAVLKGFNKKLCQILDRKLIRHQELFESLSNLANADIVIKDLANRNPLLDGEVVDLSCSPPNIHKSSSNISNLRNNSPSQKTERLKKRHCQTNVENELTLSLDPLKEQSFSEDSVIAKPKKPKINSGQKKSFERSKSLSVTSSYPLQLSEKNIKETNLNIMSGGSLNTSNSASTSKLPTKAKMDSTKKRYTDNIFSGKLLNNKKGRSYIPGYRSGGYALLVTLLKNSQKNNYKGYMTSKELQTEAQPLSKESFTKPKPHTFYTAWTAMKTLITKELVIKQKKVPARFSLTESGKALALRLLQHAQDENEDSIIEMNLNTETIISKECNGSHLKQKKNKFDDCDEDTSTIVIVEPKRQSLVKSNSHDLDEAVNSSQEKIEFTPYSFEVILLVDKMETTGFGRKDDMTVKELNKFNKMIKYELRHLKVGDFTWVARNVTTRQELILPYIVERKRIDDLAKSIKDGRYNEQKFRLKQSGIPNVVYLIESYGNNRDTAGLPMSSLMQAATNTRIQESFVTHFTTSLSDSIKFLAMMTKNLADTFMYKTLMSCNKDKFITASLMDDPIPLMVFDVFNAMASKSKPLTVKDMFIKQLLQLSGLSVEKAMAITSVYPTPQHLVKEYEDNNNPELLLTNIKYGNLSHNISSAISKSIYQYFNNTTLI